MSIKESHYLWYVEPLDDSAHANKVIGDFLHDPEERVTENLRDGNGKPHDVWMCTHAQAEKLRASQKTVQAHFAIWNRANRYVPIRYVTHIMPLGRKGKQAKKKRVKKRIYRPHPRPITEDTLNLKLPF